MDRLEERAYLDMSLGRNVSTSTKLLNFYFRLNLSAFDVRLSSCFAVCHSV